MSSLPQASILLVDDRPANLMALAETLAPLKQNIVQVASGEEALKYLLQQEFAVVLLDVQMPEMDGFELAKIIHSRPLTRHLPILFLTAINRDTLYIHKGYMVGAVDYLLKPIVPEILLAKVSVFIDLFQKTAALKHQTEQLLAANAALQQKQHELLQLSHHYQLILNAVGEGIYGIDRQGITTFLNPAAAELLGYTPEEAIGKSEYALLHSTQLKQEDSLAPCPICASLQDGLIHHHGNEQFQRKDGSYFPVEYVSTPIVEQGEIVGAVIAFQDITERRSIEQMKDDFIAIASHELRTPLTSIQGALKLLVNGIYDQKPHKTKEMLNVALRGTERLIHLVNDILDLQRLATGKLPLKKQCCDLLDLVKQAISDVQSFADQAQVQLKFSPTTIQFWVDPNTIVQVLTNLLNNAIKFSLPNTTVELSIYLINNHDMIPLLLSQQSSQVLNSKLSFPYILFTIKDQGCGIPSDKLEAIFEQFHQVDASDSRDKGGSGLGLAICRSIVEQHSGYIWVESSLGQGSIFYVALPSM